MNREFILLEGISAFARGEFLLALRSVLRSGVNGTGASEAGVYAVLAGILLARAAAYHRRLCEREGPFLFAEIPVEETQRRFQAICPYLIKALGAGGGGVTRRQGQKALRLVTLDDKGTG